MTRYCQTISHAAIADIEQVIDWYEDMQPGLGAEFFQDLESQIDIILRFPRAYPVFYKDRRAALTGRFSYRVIYRIEDDTVVIEAVFHTKQQDTAYKKRLI
jgi:plasmid stabilization system protein ParE